MIILPKVINKAEIARGLGITRPTFSDKLKGAKGNYFKESDKQAIIQQLKKAIREVERIPVV